MPYEVLFVSIAIILIMLLIVLLIPITKKQNKPKPPIFNPQIKDIFEPVNSKQLDINFWYLMPIIDTGPYKVTIDKNFAIAKDLEGRSYEIPNARLISGNQFIANLDTAILIRGSPWIFIKCNEGYKAIGNYPVENKTMPLSFKITLDDYYLTINWVTKGPNASFYLPSRWANTFEHKEPGPSGLYLINSNEWKFPLPVVPIINCGLPSCESHHIYYDNRGYIYSPECSIPDLYSWLIANKMSIYVEDSGLNSPDYSYLDLYNMISLVGPLGDLDGPIGKLVNVI